MVSRTILKAVAVSLIGVVLGLGLMFRGWLKGVQTAWEPAPERVGAIVTLAGGSGRMEAGLQLFQTGSAEFLLLSGTHQDTRLEDIFPGRDLKSLSEGVILVENRSTSTWENAIEARAVLAARADVDSLVLITSDYHMQRALYVFREVFEDDVAIYPVAVPGPQTRDGPWWKTRHGEWIMVSEFAKWCWYRIRF